MTDVPATSRRRTMPWPLLVGVAALAGGTAAGISALSLADALTATGLPDPGPSTTLGLPVVRAILRASATQRCARCVRIPCASPRHGRVGGMGGVCGVAGATDNFRCLKSTGRGTPQPREAVVVGESGQYRVRVAVDRFAGGGGDGGESGGAALVVDAAAAGRFTGDADSARTDRPLISGRFA